MRWLCDTLGALWQLARLGAISGFRFSGPYWTWRRNTAFGSGPLPPGASRWSAVLEYARWVHRMRRLQ